MSADFDRNADEKIGMKTLRTIKSPCPQINWTRLRNCIIFDLVRRGLQYHFKIKIEGENLVENLRDNNIFKNNDRENNYETEKVGRKNSVRWNHIDLILN